MSNELKSLNLDRDKIEETIEAYCKLYSSDYSISKITELDSTRNRVNIQIGDKKLYIDFHFNKNGTTTIDDFGGNNVDIKKNLAYYIKDNCLVNSGNKQDTWFVVRNIEEDDFSSILDLLCESEYYKEGYKIKKEEKSNSTIYRLKGKYNEDLTITYFKTKIVQVQGKTLLLFNEAMSMLSELLDIDQIPECYNSCYKIEIDKNAVRERCKLYMQNSYDKIHGKLQRCIYQAVYYDFIEADMFEYTAITLTAFRALEGHMKYVLKEYGVFTDRKNSVGSFFNKKSETEFEVKPDVKAKINNNDKCTKLEEAYNQYYNLRHSLSHWDDCQEDSNVDTTYMIESMHTAKTYIRDTLSIIDSYYAL